MAAPTQFPAPSPEKRVELLEKDTTTEDIVEILEGYRKEAVDNRKGGLNPRDQKWAENLDLYWPSTR